MISSEPNGPILGNGLPIVELKQSPPLHWAYAPALLQEYKAVDADRKLSSGSVLNRRQHAEGTKHRWTQGDALLPIALLDEGTEEMILTLKGRSLDRYHLSDTETHEIEPIPKPQLSVSRLNA